MMLISRPSWSALYPAALALCLSASVLGACSNRVNTQADRLAEVKVGSERAPETGTDKSTSTLTIEPLDMAAEEAVSTGCLKAWRTALEGDTKGAMEQLESLDKKYPKMLTVRFMMGQVMERSGDKAGAVKYYRDAVTKSRFNAMYTFKLAESLRTTGDAKQAIVQYRNLIGLTPEFVPGRLGLARVLWQVDPHSAEAREQAKRALELDPKSKEAKDLLEEMNAAK